MARTPSMTPAECEAILGSRGSLFVTADNVHTARKWLTASGVPGMYAAGLARAAIAAIYNDSTDHKLNDAKRKAVEAAEESGESTESAPAPASQPQATESFGSTPAAPDAQRIAAVVSAVMASMPQQSQGIDAEQVRTIIRAELPNLIPVTRIEIVQGSETRSTEPAPHHKQLPELVTALSAGLHVALVGPAGSGKTTAAEQAAAILEQKFYLHGAVQGAHELTGFKDAAGTYHRTPMRDAIEFGGIACLDEMDAGDAGGLLVANSATANHYMTFPDSTLPVRVHEGFRAVACMNTFGNGADRLYVGRSQMDAATLDRFVFISWEYDETLELAISGNDEWTKYVQAIRAGAAKEKARVVISPRASIKGARLLAAGLPRHKVENMVIWHGMDSETRRRITQSAGV